MTFGVATAAAGFAIGFRTTADQIFLSFYVLCGLTRLARFNVTVAMLPKDATGKSKYFEGTPIPFACLTSSSIMATFTFLGLIHDSLPLGTWLSGTPLEFHPTAVIFIINGVLMTSRTIQYVRVCPQIRFVVREIDLFAQFPIFGFAMKGTG